jgi:hypothetical protein
MKKATLVSTIVVVFLVGSAFGFYLLPVLSARQSYVLAFTQDGVCSPPVWGAPWAVVLNSHTTKVSPADTPLPLAETALQADPSDENFSVIGFVVPNGVYTYSLEPSDFYEGTGTVTVNGADTVVTVEGPAIGCTTTMATACVLAPEGSSLYIKITLDDGKTPVTNATIDAVPVETCSGVNTTIAIFYHHHPMVNASGVATLDAGGSTYYSITVHYGSQNYPIEASVLNSPATCASLSVPSGAVSVSAC